MTIAQNDLFSVRLKKREERRILRGHLWVYSNEIDTKVTPLKSMSRGSLVNIESYTGKSLGVGYINPNVLLCARLLTTNPQEIIDKNFFVARIKRALMLRENCFVSPYYRLIFGESDGLPGLVVDRYGEVLVAELNTAGMDNLQNIITAALIEVMQPQSILLRNDTASRKQEGLDCYIKNIYGESPSLIDLVENGVNFKVAIWEGQKTGWFYDQHLNRTRLLAYIKNKRVLDVFSYTGAWGIQAAVFGAKAVTCIDSAKNALALLEQHAVYNKVATKVEVINADAFIGLQQLITQKEQFDVIILDPPAFIKRQKDIIVGTQAYLKLHNLALSLLRLDGILFTSSCSMHMSRDNFLHVVNQAACKRKKQLVVIEQMHQAQDHPIHPAISETEYLKGFVVYQRA